VEEIEAEIAEINERLFLYDFSNLEEFQKAIGQITDKREIIELQKYLGNLKDLYNIIKIMGYTELLEKFTFDRINKLFAEVSNRIDLINLKENLQNDSDNYGLLNIALEKMNFTFRKVAEHELKIADKFREELERTRKEMEAHFDKKDPRFITLFEELKRLFRKKNIEELTSEEMNGAIRELSSIYNQANQLNNRDAQLAAKYENDTKFARIHKRIRESNLKVLDTDTALHEVLIDIKHKTDMKVLDNKDILKNQEYFAVETRTTILETLEEKGIRNLEIVRFINQTLVNEYFIERAA
jgi:type I restriction enzyme R subunit